MNEIRIYTGNNGWWVEAVLLGGVQKRQWLGSEVMAEMIAKEFSRHYRTHDNPLPIVRTSVVNS